MPSEKQSETSTHFCAKRTLKENNLIIFHQDHPQICTHTENPLLSKRQTPNFHLLMTFWGLSPSKDEIPVEWLSKLNSYCRTQAWTAALALLPCSCSSALPVLTLTQILAGRAPAADSCQQLPQGISSAHLGASAPLQRCGSRRCPWN